MVMAASEATWLRYDSDMMMIGKAVGICYNNHGNHELVILDNIKREQEVI